jgi:hypothetical protein
MSQRIFVVAMSVAVVVCGRTSVAQSPDTSIMGLPAGAGADVD